MNSTTFPSDKYEALAMLYVQNHDISSMSPEDFFKYYQDTLQAMRGYAARNRSADLMKD